MDQEIIAYLDKQLGENSQQFQDLREDIRVVASGVVSLDEKLRSFRERTEQELEDMRTLIRALSPAVVG